MKMQRFKCSNSRLTEIHVKSTVVQIKKNMVLRTLNSNNMYVTPFLDLHKRNTVVGFIPFICVKAMYISSSSLELLMYNQQKF